MATDSRKSTKALRPYEALIAVIRDAGTSLKGTEVHAGIKALGQPESTWKAWGSSLRDWIILHPRVKTTGAGGSLRYTWGDPMPAKDALDLLAKRPKAPEWLREAWREVVADTLSGSDVSSATAEPSHSDSGVNPTLRRAQERQAKINVARAVAELAIDIEEFAHNGADPQEIIERVRSSAAMRDLTPIEVAGKDSHFDPAIHKLQFGDPKPGRPVFVMKPGYSYRYDDEVIVIEQALVATA